MEAFFIEKYAKQAILRLGDRPEPKMGDNDLLIEIRAASINQLDSKLKTGEFKLIIPHAMPLILGHDLSGVVLKTGSRVTRFKAGDEVYGCLPVNRIGAYAERVAVEETYFARKPKNITFEEAASIPVVGLTAWQAFVDIAKVKPGQRVFIQAGSGGVGTIAIQVAKHLGATVATTVSGPSAEMVKGLGADVIIDYRKDDFGAVLKDYDAALNSQDAASLAKSANILKSGGNLISISSPPDPAYARAAGLNAFLRMAIWGMSYSIRAATRKRGVRYTFLFMRPNGADLEQLTKLIEAGAIRPVLDRTFPFAETPQAMAYVETGRAKGKVVVSMG